LIRTLPPRRLTRSGDIELQLVNVGFGVIGLVWRDSRGVNLRVRVRIAMLFKEETP